MVDAENIRDGLRQGVSPFYKKMFSISYFISLFKIYVLIGESPLYNVVSVSAA